MNTLLHKIHSAFAADGIRFLLVGGFAVNAHRVSRMTNDVDVAVQDADVPRALEALRKLGYVVFHRAETFYRLRPTILPFMDLDLMLLSSETFGRLIADAPEWESRGLIFKIPSVRNLIAMKLHACKHGGFRREIKDLIDVVQLIETHHLDPTEPAFREICLRYGNAGLYESILKAVRE